jgi:ligand-binding sensor domain-containing protein
MRIRDNVLLCISLLILHGCSKISGGLTGTETGNGSAGTVAFKDGRAAAGAHVTLVPYDYDPVNSSPDDIRIVSSVTDNAGRYRFRNIIYGCYNLFCEKDGFKSFIDSFYIADSVTHLDTSFLQVPGSVKGYLMYPSGTKPLNSMLVVPGSLFYIRLDPKSGAFILPDFAPGRYSARVISSTVDYFQRMYSLHVLEDRSDSSETPLVMPGNSITSILASSDSTVWVGTTNGLINIRGSEWDVYGIRERLSNSHITCLSENSDQSIWAGTLFKLARFHNGRLTQNFDFVSSIRTINVNALHSSGNGQLWVGAAEGLYCNDNGNWKSLYYSEMVPDVLIENSYQNDLSDVAVICNQNEKILVGTHHGLFIRDTEKLWRAVSGFRNMSVTAIEIIDSNSFFSGTNHGLFRCSSDTIVKVEQPSDLQLSRIVSLLRCDKRLYIGTANGLYVKEDTSWSEISLEPLNSYVTALACDHEKVVWIGTTNGLCRYYNNELEIVQ